MARKSPYRPLRRSCKLPELFRVLFLFVFFLLFHSEGGKRCSTPFSGSLLAQDRSFKAGFAAGLNTSQISGDDLSGFHQFGLAGGLFVSRPVSDKVTLELQFLFSQKGSRKTPNPKKGDYSFYNLRVNYVDLPLMLGYNFGSFELFGGPLIGAKVGGVTEETENGSIPDADRPDFEPFDVGVHAGIGYKLMEQLHFDLRLSNSILPARKFTGGTVNNKGTGQYLNRGQYHTVVSFLVKYRVLGR
ncbi:MAG: porin family protein [Flavobacteriales bacterium]